MKRFFVCGLSVVWLFLLSSCRNACFDASSVHQYSPAAIFQTGAYDGEFLLSDLKQTGNTGIGICDGLDGMFLLYDGSAYSLNGLGEVERLPDDAMIPYACIWRHEPAMRRSMTAHLNSYRVRQWINDIVPEKNRIVMFQLEGLFSSVQVRSFDRQLRPYTAFPAMWQKAKYHTRENIKGTVIGIRTPAFMRNTGPSGFTMYFINDDHSFGGQVTSFEIMPVFRVEIQLAGPFVLHLPDRSRRFQELDFDKVLKHD